MSSIIFYNPIVNDHITRNMLNPNAIKECSKSSNGHINNSVYNIDLLQWQLNTSNDSMNQFKSHNEYRRDYIRKNIRHLRQLEANMTLKRLMEQSGGSITSTDRTQYNTTCTKLASSGHHLPARQPSTSMKTQISEPKFNTSKQSSNEQYDQNDSGKQIERCNNGNARSTSFVTKPSQTDDSNAKDEFIDAEKHKVSSPNCQPSMPSNYASTTTQIDTLVNRLTQTIPMLVANSENSSINHRTQCHEDQRFATNTSDKKHRTVVTSTMPPVKSVNRTDYLRAHTRDVEDGVDLKILGNKPISSMQKHLNSAKISVPKAESAKNVEFIRRDINFVRANAHLASVPSIKSTAGIRRVASMNSLSASSSSSLINDKTYHNVCLNDTKMSKSQISHTSRMWPERRLKNGTIPPYLVKMKQQAKERIEKELENQPDPDQPPGHQRMPEQERLDTLELLNKAHSQLLEEFSHLPIRMDTLRIRCRRAEIESRLSELEQAIEIFSKPKVFIKPD